MSFLIEDILNTRSSFEKDERDKLSADYRSAPVPLDGRLRNLHDDRNSNFSDQSSILHHTLVNRTNSPYYRISESQNIISPLENFQQFCYDPVYLNYYRSLYDRDFSSTLQRQKSWPPYYSNQPNYVSYGMQYKHLYNSSKRKGGQVRFSANQTDILEKRFCSNKYLSPEERKILAESLNLSDRQVKTWFQNRRAKWRRSISSSEQTHENITAEETIKKVN